MTRNWLRMRSTGAAATLCRYVSFIAVLLLFTAGPPARAFSLPDLADAEHSWARDSIRRMVSIGAFRPYPDGTYLPEKPITRGEFAYLAARALGLSDDTKRVFADAQDHWARDELSILVNRGALRAGSDATVDPEGPVTREEMARALVVLLELDELRERAQAAGDQPLYSDVSPEDPHFAAIQLAGRLELFPPFLRGQIYPEEPVTRAEAAYAVDAASRLEPYAGQITVLDEERQLVWVRASGTEERSFPVTGVPVLSGETWTSWRSLKEGDRLRLVSNRFGRPLVAWTEPRTASDSLLESLQALATSLLTADQLRSIIDGDWEAVGQAVKAALYEEMVKRGVRPWEAEALLAQDWDTVQELGRQRIAEAVAGYLNISVSLASALLNRQWDVALEQAQVEVLERLLQKHLFKTEPAETSPAPAAADAPGVSAPGASDEAVSATPGPALSEPEQPASSPSQPIRGTY